MKLNRLLKFDEADIWTLVSIWGICLLLWILWEFNPTAAIIGAFIGNRFASLTARVPD